ncbi:MAG: hypothetical protein JJU45_11485 [Acidimicrobiia bacterium]|nr:hypothetical protein [Acidimicrobiia bacterium]
MAPVVRNRRQPWELTEDDVTAALARIGDRDEDLAREAGHVYNTLTWNEGPGRLRRAGVQDWLWYQVPTKYMTDEVGYMGRLAEAAATLFDELGLDAYAAVCRDERTAAVHAAFERSDTDGFKALRKARDASGIAPPDLDDFAWGQTMGMEEFSAHATVENALEAAVDAGDLAVGGRGWRIRQQEITAATLDGDHPDQPGQSWRTVVVTERIGEWVRTASRRCERVGRRRADIANRLLHPVTPPEDLADHMEPVTWLLERFGNEQTLTQSGYLNRAFVVQVHEQHPWDDPFRPRGRPRSEIDVTVLRHLREWLESAGALRKRAKVLRRTERGAAMADDPQLAWEVFTRNVAAQAWDRFVIEDAALILLERRGPVAPNDLFGEIAGDAAELGWQTSDGGLQRSPSEQDVLFAFHESWPLLELFGFAAEQGDWRNRAVSIPPAGEATLLAMLRSVATGPRSRPW